MSPQLTFATSAPILAGDGQRPKPPRPSSTLPDLAARGHAGSCAFLYTKERHDWDGEGYNCEGTLLRFIRATPARPPATAAGSFRSGGHGAFDQGLSCSSEMSLLV